MSRPWRKFARQFATDDGKPILCARSHCGKPIATLVDVPESDAFPAGLMVAARYGFEGFHLVQYDAPSPGGARVLPRYDQGFR
jgi:hypothetical protein